MSKNKEFDSVQMMRSIREKVQQEWSENPKLIEMRLKEIRKRLNIKEDVLPANAQASLK